MEPALTELMGRDTGVGSQKSARPGSSIETLSDKSDNSQDVAITSDDLNASNGKS